jgi:hypothetical protein
LIQVKPELTMERSIRRSFCSFKRAQTLGKTRSALVPTAVREVLKEEGGYKAGITSCADDEDEPLLDVDGQRYAR